MKNKFFFRLLVITALSLGISSCAHQEQQRRMAGQRTYQPNYTYDYGYDDLPTYGDTYYYYDTVSAPQRSIEGDMEYYWYPRQRKSRNYRVRERDRNREIITDGYGPYYSYGDGE